jgi:IS605 OrfB family transposase
VGLDRGVYNLVTTSDGVNYGSKQVRAKRREHLFLRKKLQQKGTRSAKRLLKKRSGKEKRFMLDYNHKLVNTIIKTNPNTGTFVLETLTGIRNHRKGKKMNTFLSQWSYHQLETILTYKAETLGIMVKHIDPRYTSQACNQCGVINKNNRKKNKYSCECGWEAHADVNAALNIRDLGVSGRMKLSQSLQVGQGVVNHPNEPEQVLIVSGSSPEARPLGN